MTDEAQNTRAEESEKPSLLSKMMDKVRDVVEDVKEGVGDVVADVKEKVGLASDEVADKAEDAVETVSDATSEAKAEAEDAVEAVSDEVADVKADVQDAVETVSDEVADVKADAQDVVETVSADAETGASEPVVASDDSSVMPVVTQTTSDEPAGDVGATFTPTSDDNGSPRRLADLTPGMEMEGRVTSTALYGIFVDVGVGRDGLVHISEMSDQRIESPTDLVQIGDTVKVRVKSVDPDARRISLTMRTPRQEGGERRRRPKRPEVDSGKLQDIKAGDLIEGTVNGIAPFGVFVDIGVGKDGLVHISELAESRVEKAEDAVTIGQSYTFRVLEVDSQGQRISLSLRRAQEGYQEKPKTPRRREANLDAIAPGTILDGKVSGLAPFGAFIDLGVGRDGLVHISELAEGRVGKVEDVVKVGDAVKVRVLEVDPNSKRISLSMRLEVPTAPVSTSGSSRLDRDWTNPANREREEGAGERPAQQDRAPRPERQDRGERRKGGRNDRNEQRSRSPEVYSFGEAEEEDYNGNATLDDLLSKFGQTDDRRSKKRYEREDDEDDDGESRESRMRRDAIRRTLRDNYDE